MASAVIGSIRSVSGNQPAMRRFNEKAAQTFLNGVPVKMDTTVGGIIEWDAVGPQSSNIAGIAKEAASNLTTTGVARTTTEGPPVPYQASAVNIPRGAKLNDGRIAVEVATQDTVFFGQVGPAQTTAVTDVGKQYGLTKDADNHWYVDKTKTGANACVEIVKLDTIDTSRGVHFVFIPLAQQLVA